jgi:hypothetical protein
MPEPKKDYTDEKVHKKYVTATKKFIGESYNLQYIKVKDIYLEPLIKNYENFINENTPEKHYSNAADVCSFPKDSNGDSKNDRKSEIIFSIKNKIVGPTLQKNIFFHSTDNKTILFYFDIINDSEYLDLQIFGLINIENNNFVSCGNIGMHPYVAINNFTYENSDGSGPDISKKMIDITDPQLIISALTIYFEKISNNSYH